MSEWTTPKTDWEKTDYFNVDDYNRIRGNTEYLNDLLPMSSMGYQGYTIGDDIDTSSPAFPIDSLNNIKETLTVLSDYAFDETGLENNYDFTAYENGQFLTASTLNTLESEQAEMYDIAVDQGCEWVFLTGISGTFEIASQSGGNDISADEDYIYLPANSRFLIYMHFVTTATTFTWTLSYIKSTGVSAKIATKSSSGNGTRNITAQVSYTVTDATTIEVETSATPSSAYVRVLKLPQ